MANLRDIKERLQKDNLVNGEGNKKWYVSNLNQILTNKNTRGCPLKKHTL